MGQRELERRADVSCRKSTIKGLSAYVKEHFPNAAYGAYPIANDSKVAVIIVANKYSPNNFWYVALGTELSPYRITRLFPLTRGKQERTLALAIHLRPFQQLH